MSYAIFHCTASLKIYKWPHLTHQQHWHRLNYINEPNIIPAIGRLVTLYNSIQQMPTSCLIALSLTTLLYLHYTNCEPSQCTDILFCRAVTGNSIFILPLYWIQHYHTKTMSINLNLHNILTSRKTLLFKSIQDTLSPN